jgi:hypothetical protein
LNRAGGQARIQPVFDEATARLLCGFDQVLLAGAERHMQDNRCIPHKFGGHDGRRRTEEA